MKNKRNTQNYTPIAQAAALLVSGMWLCMGQVQAQAQAYVTPVFAKVGTYDITECVADTANGLIWEGNIENRTQAGSKKYTNYDSSYMDARDINMVNNSIGYVNAANAVRAVGGGRNPCGFNDWRMPTKEELLTLVKKGSSPTIDTKWFPNTPTSFVWSGSPVAGYAAGAWSVSFFDGSSQYYDRSSSFGVRLVRGGKVTLTAQTITFGTAPSLQAGGATTGTVTATGGVSGNPVTFSSNTTSICAVDSSTGVVTPVAQGICTIAANQAGNSKYSAASQVTQSITVTSRYAFLNGYKTTECVADTANDLIWEGKTESGTRAGSKKYTNYDSNYGTPTQINVATNSIGYVNTVNASKLCGFSDWRMPTFDELLTLIKIWAGMRTIDTTWFPNTPASGVWSGSPYAYDASLAWNVYFYDDNVYFFDGNAKFSYRGNYYGVRLVRTASKSPSSGLSGVAAPVDAIAAPPSITTGNTSAIGGNLDNTLTGGLNITTTPSTVSGTAGGELLSAGGTTITAGSKGGSVQVINTAGVSNVAVVSGSANIPCTSVGTFCKSVQNPLTVFAGERMTLAADGTVTSIQINPATPSTAIERLNGKSVMDAVVETIRASASTLGAETERTANDWNALGVGFSKGRLSASAQLPMQVNPTLPDGVNGLPNGTLQVVTQGIVVNLTPSLVDAARFAEALQTLNPMTQTQLEADGTIGINHDQTLYSVRPSLFTTNPDNSSLSVGNDGVLRFGNQALPPATYNFDQFSTMLTGLDAAANVTVQADGKLELVFQGTRYTLSPDYQVAPTASNATPSSFEIQNGKLFVHYPFGLSQGFSIRQ